MNAESLHKEKGFTLIEILITLGIVGVLFGLISAPLMSFYRDIVYRGNVENVLTMLDEARKSTLSSYYSSQYGVHVATSTVTLFKGATYSAVDPDNDVFELSGIVEITETNITGGGDEIVFERITGETSQDGTLVVSLLVGRMSSSTITIHKSGLVEVD